LTLSNTPTPTPTSTPSDTSTSTPSINPTPTPTTTDVIPITSGNLTNELPGSYMIYDGPLGRGTVQIIVPSYVIDYQYVLGFTVTKKSSAPFVLQISVGTSKTTLIVNDIGRFTTDVTSIIGTRQRSVHQQTLLLSSYEYSADPLYLGGGTVQVVQANKTLSTDPPVAGGISGGIIAAIIIPIVVSVLICCCILWILIILVVVLKRRKKEKESSRSPQPDADVLHYKEEELQAVKIQTTRKVDHSETAYSIATSKRWN